MGQRTPFPFWLAARGSPWCLQAPPTPFHEALSLPKAPVTAQILRLSLTSSGTSWRKPCLGRAHLIRLGPPRWSPLLSQLVSNLLYTCKISFAASHTLVRGISPEERITKFCPLCCLDRWRRTGEERENDVGTGVQSLGPCTHGNTGATEHWCSPERAHRAQELVTRTCFLCLWLPQTGFLHVPLKTHVRPGSPAAPRPNLSRQECQPQSMLPTILRIYILREV